MTHVMTCDWCGEAIDSWRDSFAQLVVNVHQVDDDGEPVRPAARRTFRDYHADERPDGTTCVDRAVRMLDGPSLDLETAWDPAMRVDELALGARITNALLGAGVVTVAQLDEYRWRGGLDELRGIGPRARASIDALLDGEAARVRARPGRVV